MPHESAIRTLIEDEDPLRRAEAHIVLGRRALQRADPETAKRHFRLAARLNPDDVDARTALLELEGVQSRGRTSAPLSMWRYMLGRKQAEA